MLQKLVNGKIQKKKLMNDREIYGIFRREYADEAKAFFYVPNLTLQLPTSSLVYTT